MPLEHLDLTAFDELVDLQRTIRCLEGHLDTDARRKLRPILALANSTIQGLKGRLRDVLGNAEFTPGLPLVFSISHTLPKGFSIGVDRHHTASSARGAAAIHFAVGNDPGRVQLGLCIRKPQMPQRLIFYAWQEGRLEPASPAPGKTFRL